MVDEVEVVIAADYKDAKPLHRMPWQSRFFHPVTTNLQTILRCVIRHHDGTGSTVMRCLDQT